MGKIKRFFTTKPAILGAFTIVSTFLAIPLIFLVAQEKQPTQQYAAESVKGAMTGTLAGYVYVDSNNNGQRDAEEKAYPYAAVMIATKISTGYQTRTLSTDSFGYFNYKFTKESQTSPFQLKLILPAGYKTTTPNPIVVQKTQKQIVEFGVIGNAIATPTPSCMLRPACLDSVPRCLVAEPIEGWCPAPSVYPSRYPTKPLNYMRKPEPTKIVPSEGIRR